MMLYNKKGEPICELKARPCYRKRGGVMENFPVYVVEMKTRNKRKIPKEVDPLKQIQNCID